MEQFLIILQGASGGGKSTKAKELAPKYNAVIYSTDDFSYDAGGAYHFEPAKLGYHHADNFNRTAEALSKGISVIVDKTSIRRWESKKYVEFAVKLGIKIEFVRCEGRYQNIHGVPEDKVESMRNSMEDLTVENVLASKSPFDKPKSLVEKAKDIAIEAHKNQSRKWADIPYIAHPRSCALIAALNKLPDIDIAVMWLHDVMEDCGEVWGARIRIECGNEVFDLVKELTFPTEGPEWEGMPRAEKNVVREFIMKNMSDRAKVLKMIDTLDNIHDMRGCSKKYVEKIVVETYRRLEILGHTHLGLSKDIKIALQNLEDQFKIKRNE